MREDQDMKKKDFHYCFGIKEMDMMELGMEWIGILVIVLAADIGFIGRGTHFLGLFSS